MKKFQIHIASGSLIIIDPMFIDYAQNPLGSGVKPIHENKLFLDAKGVDRLRSLEAIAMGRAEMKDPLRTIGFNDLNPIETGSYTFTIEDICRARRCDDDVTKQFSVDSSQILVFDMEYLDGVLQHFSWKDAYSGNRVNRKREREHGQMIASRDDVYVQVQSPGVKGRTDFIGDGEYFFRDGALRPVG